MAFCLMSVTTTLTVADAALVEGACATATRPAQPSREVKKSFGLKMKRRKPDFILLWAT
jgi:hypothetical protein